MAKPTISRWEEAMSLLYRLTVRRELGADAEIEVGKKDAATVVAEP